jgi:hypothetical protein
MPDVKMAICPKLYIVEKIVNIRNVPLGGATLRVFIFKIKHRSVQKLPHFSKIVHHKKIKYKKCSHQ